MKKTKRTITFRKVVFLNLTPNKDIDFQTMINRSLESCSFPVIRRNSDDYIYGLSLDRDGKSFYEINGCSCAWISKFNSIDQVQLAGIEDERIICESIPPVNLQGIERNVENYSIAFAVKGNYIAYITKATNIDRILESFINLAIIKNYPDIGSIQQIQLHPIISDNALSKIALAEYIKEVQINTKGAGMMQPRDSHYENKDVTPSLISALLRPSFCGSDSLYNEPLDLAGIKANLSIKCEKKAQQNTRQFVAKLAATIMHAEELDIAIYLKDRDKTVIRKNQIILKRVIEIDKRSIRENGENYELYMREASKSLTECLEDGTFRKI